MVSSAESNSPQTLAPLLSVRRGKQAIDFYKAAFEATVLTYVESPDGEVVAEMQIGKSSLWVADESTENKNFSPESLGGSTARMVLVVADPDAVFARAVGAGATIVYEVADQRCGWRVGRVVDPFGHHWEIEEATRLRRIASFAPLLASWFFRKKRPPALSPSSRSGPRSAASRRRESLRFCRGFPECRDSR